jgi:TorA maturation chaperone TorD
MTDEVRDAIAQSAQILGALFSENPKSTEAQPLFDQLSAARSLVDWPFGSPADLALAEDLICAGLAAPRQELAQEYQRLFIGPYAFEAPAWGSVYLDRESVLFGSSTLELRQWMRANGIVSHQEKREPEDQIGKMLVLLGWLAAEKPELVPEFLAEHLLPWAPRYLELLRKDAGQPFYEGLAVLTQATLGDIATELDVQVTEKKLYR